MRVKTILVLLCIGTIQLFSQSKELMKVFDDGNKLYLDQKYEAAIQQYQSIINNGYENGEVYFNLGNAYFKSGEIAKAILNYERAKRFMPNDDDLLFNLRLANAQLVDKVDEIPELFIYRWMESLLTIFPLTTMIWMIYILFLITLGLFSWFLFARTFEQKRLTLIGGIITSILMGIGIANFVIQSYRESHTEYAIVMADVANIKSAPDNSGNDLFVLHHGLKVQLLDNVNNWEKIRLADGKIGWIPDDEIETI